MLSVGRAARSCPRELLLAHCEEPLLSFNTYRFQDGPRVWKWVSWEHGKGIYTCDGVRAVVPGKAWYMMIFFGKKRRGEYSSFRSDSHLWCIFVFSSGWLVVLVYVVQLLRGARKNKIWWTLIWAEKSVWRLRQITTSSPQHRGPTSKLYKKHTDMTWLTWTPDRATHYITNNIHSRSQARASWLNVSNSKVARHSTLDSKLLSTLFPQSKEDF